MSKDRKTTDETKKPQEIAEDKLDKVAGGLNPQPLPPRGRR